jgi:hypothetical protein
MKNSFLALLIGVLIGGGVVWYFQGKKQEPPPPPPAPMSQSPMGKTMQDVKKNVGEKADSFRTALDAKIEFLHLKADEIKEELAAKGKIVRSQSREWASDVQDAARDAKITAEIKGKYAVDPDVSALHISVNTTDGIVTLAGSASSYESISKATLIAMETEGARQVISTIQVK